MTRKPRSDTTPFDRFRDQLDQWLLVDNLSYDDALAQLVKIWPEGERKPSRSSLARWAEKRRQERVLEKIAESARSAQAVTAQFAANPHDAYGALLNLIGQAAFEVKIQSGNSLDMDTLKDLAEVVQVGLRSRNEEAKLALRERDLALKERRIVLLEKQAADATETLADGAMTDDQKMARFREIFGIKT